MEKYSISQTEIANGYKCFQAGQGLNLLLLYVKYDIMVSWFVCYTGTGRRKGEN